MAHATIRSTKSEKLLQTELMISYVLRVGVILCAWVISFGVLLTWIKGDSLRQFSGQILPALLSGQTVADVGVPRSAFELGAAVVALHPNAVIALGLLLLIALPIVRVALTVFLFLFEKDYVYLAVTLFVLVVLLSGIILGRSL